MAASSRQDGLDRLLHFGPYRLVKLLGKGAGGVVYQARTEQGAYRRDVCIKRLPAKVGIELARAMQEEARVLLGIRHSNVVSLLAVGEEPGGAPYLVMELVLGLDLHALCRKAPGPSADQAPGYFPDAVCVHVACALVRAVGAVQRAMPGLVHRDVSPHNVLLSTEGEVKLADFGIALARDRARWTRPSLIKGKLGYMSPEQAGGEDLDVRSDLFAVGVVLYELLARVRPWSPMQGMDEFHAVERGAGMRLADRRKVDPGLASVVEMLLAHDPADRPPTADDALRALAPFGAGEVGSLELAAAVKLASIARH